MGSPLTDFHCAAVVICPPPAGPARPLRIFRLRRPCGRILRAGLRAGRRRRSSRRLRAGRFLRQPALRLGPTRSLRVLRSRVRAGLRRRRTIGRPLLCRRPPRRRGSCRRAAACAVGAAACRDCNPPL